MGAKLTTRARQPGLPLTPRRGFGKLLRLDRFLNEIQNLCRVSGERSGPRAIGGMRRGGRP